MCIMHLYKAEIMKNNNNTMMTEATEQGKMNIYGVMTTYVRAFFEAYMTGVLDEAYADADMQEKLKPKNVKQAMLDCYGEVGASFFDQMFYTMAQLAYENVDEAVARVQCECGEQADIPQYMRVACANDALYEAMVNEYKRNFEALLAGGMPNVQEHLATCAKGEGVVVVSNEQAIRLLVRLVMRSYAKGVRMKPESHCPLNQVSLLRLLTQHLNLLVHGCVLDGDFETLDDLLLHVCGNENGFRAMSDEMNTVMRQLAQ